MTAPRKLALVGDVMLATTKAETFASESPGFAAATDRLRSSDAIVANLEMPLSTRGYRVPKHSNLRSHPDVIRGVTGMGIHAVSLANNHMMDYGPDALTDTLDHRRRHWPRLLRRRPRPRQRPPTRDPHRRRHDDRHAQLRLHASGRVGRWRGQAGHRADPRRLLLRDRRQPARRATRYGPGRPQLGRSQRPNGGRRAHPGT